MYHIYTDGSCRGNEVGKGIGAWGFAVYDDNYNLIHKECGSRQATTNNYMEMNAVLQAMIYASTHRGVDYEIVMDSNLVYRGIMEWVDGWERRGWIKADKKPVLNKELWMSILEEKRVIERNMMAVSFRKTKGHADDQYNNYVDNMVQTESMRLKNDVECNH